MSEVTQGASQFGSWLRGFANKTCASVPELMEWRVIDALQRKGLGLLEEHGVPGVQLCMRIGQREAIDIALGVASLYRGANGVLAVPMIPATRVVTGSLSKPITAALALLLVQDGVLQLDVPLGELGDEISLDQRGVTDCGKWRKYSREMSVRHLLSHTSGLASVHPPHSPADAILAAGETQASCASAMVRGDMSCWSGVEFLAPPGTQTCYSGANYLVLEFVIERVLSRQLAQGSKCEGINHFAQFAKRRLFEPLRLQRCGYEQGVARGSDIAEFHVQNATSQIEQSQRMGVFALGASGFTGSCRDVVTIISEVLRAAQSEAHDTHDTHDTSKSHTFGEDAARAHASDNPIGLDSSLAKLLFSVPAGQGDLVVSAQTFTHGLHLYKDHNASLLDHGGERPGYRGVIHVYPGKKVVVCMMANGENGSKVNSSILGLIKGMML